MPEEIATGLTEPCKFCLAREASVRAHVIPRSFFEAHANPGDPARLISTLPSTHPKRMPIGVYDETILCDQCEPRFSAWDDYGDRFFNKRPGFEVLYPGEEAECLVARDADYTRLKLFVLSVVWRAHASRHAFYSRINLGPHARGIREMLDQADPGPANKYPVFLSKFEHAPDLVPMISPTYISMGDRTLVQVIMGGFKVMAMVDGRPCPADLLEWALTLGRPETVILTRPFRGSPEHRIAVKAAMAHPKVWPSRRS